MIETTDRSAQLVLFEDIQTALQPIITDGTITDVIIFNSQTDFEAQERFKGFPFVAVDINVEWGGVEATSGEPTTLSQNFQKGNCIIAIHHVFENIDNETVAFQEAEPIRHEVYRRLNCLLNQNYFTPLTRTGSTLDTSHDRVFDYITLFNTNLLESAFEALKETVSNVEPVLNTDLVIENETIRTAKTEDL